MAPLVIAIPEWISQSSSLLGPQGDIYEAVYRICDNRKLGATQMPTAREQLHETWYKPTVKHSATVRNHQLVLHRITGE